MPQRRNRQQLAELKSKVQDGEWAAGGRELAITHFWPDDYNGMPLCGLTWYKGRFKGTRHCKKCSEQYQRIVDAKPPLPEYIPQPLTDLRSAVSDLIFWMREWKDPDPQVMIQALWLITLDGVPNSGVKGMSQKVLALMRDLAKQEIHPQHALELLKGWES